MALWNSAEAAAATGGRATCDWECGGVSIDTRTIAPGDLFVALTDMRDGHDFVAQALAKGAAAALVSRVPEGVAPDSPLLIVDEVLPALERLGIAGRARTAAKVIAVTGSVGKTSTKEMLRAALAGQGRVHAAEASYNNHWGVPLTLARMPADSDFAVIEIGMNHPGEIAPLARFARPHCAMITTIAAAHIGAFGHIDGIAHEKAAIFDGLEPGGVAVVPSGLSTTPILTAGALAHHAHLTLFGAEGEARLTGVTPEGEALRIDGEINGTKISLRLNSMGEHFAMNAIGVLAAAQAVGVDVTAAARGLENWNPPLGRGAVEWLGGIRLIDDAYNANPTSLSAGLATLARLPGQRRVAILGDMLELGPDEAEQHRKIAQDKALASVDLVHCAGPLMRNLHDALPAAKRGEWVETAALLAERATELVGAGDSVLVKGSKGSRISTVVDALRKAGDSTASQKKE